MRILQSIFNLLRFNRKNWKAVTLCVIAATVFWLFNALNKRYTTNINLPLVFDYDQENFVAIRPLPELVRFNVTGVGWNLFRRSAGLQVPPLIVPLAQPADIKKIVGSTVPGLVVNQPEGFDINFVLTDTLHIAIEPKDRKWIRVKVDTPPLLFRRGHGRVSDVQVFPDSVFIEGPAKLIKSLPEIIDLKIEDRNIDDDFHEDVEVKFLNDELIRRNPPTVSVAFEVDNYVDVRDSVRLQILNPPRNAVPVIGGKKVVCTFSMPESARDTFNAASVRALVDLKNITRGEAKVLPYITGLPRYSRVVALDSISIKF